MKKKKLGRLGEDTAVRYLVNKGYHLRTRNYNTRYGEIDIVCCQGPALVFVEVKTRTSLIFGTPEEAITPRKIDHIKKAALSYLQQEALTGWELRFDVITIVIQEDQVNINHIENAF